MSINPFNHAAMPMVNTEWNSSHPKAVSLNDRIAVLEQQVREMSERSAHLAKQLAEIHLILKNMNEFIGSNL